MLNSTGPVRGICFHSQQPLFVSGGDDYKIKVSLVGLVEIVEWVKANDQYDDSGL